ncbi:hypothetical protein [Sulfurospirillum sp. 1612]|uniref:hypothetical protein n=1 Tax=Sulfurospirillum sp. 1612 TaxID=3094835 RepID=UPI002F958664
MGLFGGSATSSGITTSSINFNPSIIFGKDNSTSSTPTLSQTPTSSQTTRDGLSAAASVGLLGGTAGQASLSEAPMDSGTDPQAATAESTASGSNFDLKTFGIGLAGIGGVMLVKNGMDHTKHKKKKAK